MNPDPKISRQTAIQLEYELQKSGKHILGGHKLLWAKLHGHRFLFDMPKDKVQMSVKFARSDMNQKPMSLFVEKVKVRVKDNKGKDIDGVIEVLKMKEEGAWLL